LAEVNAKKKALKNKKKIQKELIKKNLAALDLIVKKPENIKQTNEFHRENKINPIQSINCHNYE
jgi:hypothetical protein